MNWTVYPSGLTAMCLLAFITWLLSLYRKDVSIVDSIWSLMFVAATLVYLFSNEPHWTLSTSIVFVMVVIWALRLSAHLTWRNWGEPEDLRYQQIRANNSPNFALKSLFIVFLLQALLAWFISMPLFAVFTTPFDASITTLTLFVAGFALWSVGMYFETVADWQLYRFRQEPSNHGKVLDSGLWRYSRHPNYFGECLIWWGFYLLALSIGAWWTVIAPIVMTWLLLKISGVVMLEKTITNRRPAYRDYIQRTNAFIPGPVRLIGKQNEECNNA